MWKLFCYDEGKEINLWQSWYDDAADDVKAKHDTVWEFLEVNEISEWREPRTSAINGFVEVRLPGKVAWRVMGFFGPGRREFTVVLVCFHKGTVYTPTDCLKTAKKRVKEVQDNLNRRKICARPQ